MIRHIVLLKFSAQVDADAKASLKAELEALRGHLDGIIDFNWGTNISPESSVVHGFQDGFWFDFETLEARDAYLADANHQMVGAKLVARTEGGTEGVIVFDVEV